MRRRCVFVSQQGKAEAVSNVVKKTVPHAPIVRATKPPLLKKPVLCSATKRTPAPQGKLLLAIQVVLDTFGKLVRVCQELADLPYLVIHQGALETRHAGETDSILDLPEGFAH